MRALHLSASMISAPAFVAALVSTAAAAAQAGVAWVEEELPDVPEPSLSTCLGRPAFAGDEVLIGDECLEQGGREFQGGVHVLRREGDRWRFTGTTLVASDATERDAFGNAVAVEGNTAVIGAHGSELSQTPTKAGQAYVFTRTASGWVQAQRLTAPDGAPGDLFGDAVAISGDTLVVGARAKDAQGNENQGAVYVFVRAGTSWSHQATLTSLVPQPRAFFGTAFAIEGDTLLVGNASWRADQINKGAVQVFQRASGAWTHAQTLTVPDGQERDSFGASVALDGSTALAGSLRAFEQRGAAYPLLRSAAGFELGAPLDHNPPEVVANPQFGGAVALDGDFALVGGGTASTRVAAFEGVVLAYRRSGSGWVFEQLIAPLQGDEAGLGRHLAIAGDRALLVGKRVHAYHRAGALTPTDGGLHDAGADAASGGALTDSGAVLMEGGIGTPPTGVATGSSDTSGCGCRVAPRTRGGFGAWWSLCAAAALLVARRSRRSLTVGPLRHFTRGRVGGSPS